MIRCYKVRHIDRDTDNKEWILDKTFDCGDMLEDIKWSTAWLLGKSIYGSYLDINGYVFFPRDTDVLKTEKELIKMFVIEKEDLGFDIEDEDFLI